MQQFVLLWTNTRRLFIKTNYSNLEHQSEVDKQALTQYNSEIQTSKEILEVMLNTRFPAGKTTGKNHHLEISV